MKNEKQISTVLDLSDGFGFGLLYDPVIGQTTPTQFPFAVRFSNRGRGKTRLARRVRDSLS